MIRNGTYSSAFLTVQVLSTTGLGCFMGCDINFVHGRGRVRLKLSHSLGVLRSGMPGFKTIRSGHVILAEMSNINLQSASYKSVPSCLHNVLNAMGTNSQSQLLYDQHTHTHCHTDVRFP